MKGETMRIYLKEKRDVAEITKGGVEQNKSYPRAGFYNAPDSQAEEWIANGVAFEATEDNKVQAFTRGEENYRLVDLDNGGSLDGLYCDFTPLAEPEPEPEPETLENADSFDSEATEELEFDDEFADGED